MKSCISGLKNLIKSSFRLWRTWKHIRTLVKQRRNAPVVNPDDPEIINATGGYKDGRTEKDV